MAHLNDDFNENMGQIIDLKEIVQTVCSDSISRIDWAETQLAAAEAEGEAPATVEAHRVDIAAARALLGELASVVGVLTLQEELLNVEDAEPAFQ